MADAASPFPGLPSANVFGILAQAPVDLANLVSRQASEAMGMMNLGVQRLGAELSLPPLPMQLPMSLPQLPSLGNLSFPGMPMSAPAAKAAEMYSSEMINFPMSAAGPRVVV